MSLAISLMGCLDVKVAIYAPCVQSSLVYSFLPLQPSLLYALFKMLQCHVESKIIKNGIIPWHYLLTKFINIVFITIHI